MYTSSDFGLNYPWPVDFKFISFQVENTIRWRYGYDKDQNPVKESNARIVKWSDGSMSLYLGSEIFDMYKQPLQVSIFSVLITHYLYLFWSS
jgi:hypothetical protein